MLSEVVSPELILLGAHAENWEDAVRVCTAPLVKAAKVTEAYVDDIIKGVKDLGPYIVLAEHVALPHARPESGALEPAVGICVLDTPVEFGSKENDPVKYLFALSAKDSNGHLETMSSLVELLSQPDFFDFLDSAKSADEVMDYIKSHE